MSTELETTGGQVMDLRIPATDSWTAVLQDVITLAQGIASTDFVPPGLRGSVEKTTAAVLTGRELGLPPMTALASIHVIQGRPGISAELMRALIQRDGHEFIVDEMSEVKCRVRGRRAGGSEWSSAQYTMAEAQRAGDPKKNPNYGTRPAEMLLARATTRLARMAFADVIHGLSALEEIEVEDEPGTRAPVPTQVQRVGRTTRPASKPTSPPPAPPAPAPAKETAPQVEAVRSAPVVTVDDEVVQDDDPVDADVIDDEVTRAEVDRTPSGDRAPASVPLGGGQRAQIVMHFQRLGIVERDERLHWTSVLAGRDIDSTNSLTRSEATQVITRLGRFRDQDALERELGLAGDRDE